MGIRDLLTAALIASSWYPQDSQDLEKLAKEADSLYEKKTSEDLEKALKIYQKVFEQTDDRDIEKKLFQCRIEVISDKFNSAQKLWEFAYKSRDEREKLSSQFNVKTPDEAKEIAKPLYRTVIEQGELVVKSRPMSAETWKVLSVSYARFAEFEKSLGASRMLVRLKPH